jgi:hypothetical protein
MAKPSVSVDTGKLIRIYTDSKPKLISSFKFVEMQFFEMVLMENINSNGFGEKYYSEFKEILKMI